MSALRRLQTAAADFTTPRLQRDPVEVDIPQIRNDPAYAAAVGLLSTITDRIEWLSRERERIDLEQHLGRRAPDPKSQTDTALRSRLALLNQHAAAAPAAIVSPDSPSPVIARAMAVLSGAPVPPALDHGARIADIDRQIDALREAVMEQTVEVERIAGELTFEYATRLRPAWNHLQVEMYRAAQELARGAKRVREFRSAITAAGIQSRSDILAMPNVRAPLILGDESVYDSEISEWRRILERLEIL